MVRLGTVQVRSWPAVVYMGHPVVKALHALFHALAEAELASSSSSSTAKKAPAPAASPPGLGPLRAVAAGELKEALSPLPGQLFPPGAPCEPGALLLNVYERIREVAAMRGILPLADTVFGTPVAEAVQCRSCGRVTRQAAYVQYLLPAQVGGWWMNNALLGWRILFDFGRVGGCRVGAKCNGCCLGKWVEGTRWVLEL